MESTESYSYTGLKDFDAKWHVKYSGNPHPNVVWKDSHGNEIPWTQTIDENGKFDVMHDNRTTTLRIRNLRISDSGNYTLNADNGLQKNIKAFELLVYGEKKSKINLNFMNQILPYFFRSTTAEYIGCVAEER